MRNEEHTMTTTNNALHAEVGVSHCQGHRDQQQDALLVTPDLIAVADGFGERDDVAAATLAAHAAGGLAGAISEVAPEVSASLPGQPGSGTTLTAVTLAGSTARITHIGDARVWLLRAGELRQLTHDHTIVAALIETGQLTTEEARSHEHRNLLNRALTPGVVADETAVNLRPGDRLVLTTDGVHSYVDNLAELLTASATPQEVADSVAAAVSEAGEPDNHTTVVADLT
jgi:serine/threonine protein phosphatase PrpC